MDDKQLNEILVSATYAADPYIREAHVKQLEAEIHRRGGMVDELLEGDPMRWGGPCYLCHRSTEHADDCAWVQVEEERDWGPEDSSGDVLRIGAGGGWVWEVRGSEQPSEWYSCDRAGHGDAPCKPYINAKAESNLELTRILARREAEIAGLRGALRELLNIMPVMRSDVSKRAIAHARKLLEPDDGNETTQSR